MTAVSVFNQDLWEERFKNLSEIVKSTAKQQKQTTETVNLLAKTVNQIEVRREGELKILSDLINKVNTIESEIDTSIRAVRVNESKINMWIWAAAFVFTLVPATVATYHWLLVEMGKIA